MHLVRPTTEYKESYLKFVSEFLADSSEISPFVIKWETDDWDAFLNRFKEAESGYNSRKDLVPAITFWMIDEKNEVVGVSNLRKRLNPRLIHSGGHIGYGIRPSARRRGYAREILRLTLIEALRLGIEDVMVSCRPANVGSKKAILANGGFPDGTVEMDGETLERFWIFQ